MVKENPCWECIRITQVHCEPAIDGRTMHHHNTAKDAIGRKKVFAITDDPLKIEDCPYSPNAVQNLSRGRQRYPIKYSF